MNFVRPFTFLLLLIPEQLMWTLTDLIGTRFTDVIDIAILIAWIRARQQRTNLVRDRQVDRNDLPIGFARAKGRVQFRLTW